MATMKFKDGSTLRYLSVTAEMLSAAKIGPKSMNLVDLCRDSNMPMAQHEFLASLCNLGLLKHDRKQDTFKTTKKGNDFLDDYEKLQSQLT